MGNIRQCHLGGKNLKGEEKKGENVKEKKGEELRQKGHDTSQKASCCERGKNIFFSERGNHLNQNIDPC